MRFCWYKSFRKHNDGLWKDMFYLDSSLAWVMFTDSPMGFTIFTVATPPAVWQQKPLKRWWKRPITFLLWMPPWKLRWLAGTSPFFIRWYIFIHGWVFQCHVSFLGLFLTFFRGPWHVKLQGFLVGRGLNPLDSWIPRDCLSRDSTNKQSNSLEMKKPMNNLKSLSFWKSTPNFMIYICIYVYIYILCCSVVQKGNSCRNMFKYV